MQKALDAVGRQHLRISYAAGKVAIRCSKSGPAIAGSLLDISVTGCLVLMSEPLHVTSDHMVEVCLDLTHLAVRAMGFVRHVSKTDNSVGIEFYKLSPKDEADLDGFIRFFAPL